MESFISNIITFIFYPTLPSKEIVSNFCASTANSIGSLFNTSFAYPFTISPQADTGTKMIHLGKNTRSTIVSKGISAGHSENSYRGLVRVAEKADNARNYSQCDSLLLGDKCGAHTFPLCPGKFAIHSFAVTSLRHKIVYTAFTFGISRIPILNRTVFHFCTVMHDNLYNSSVQLILIPHRSRTSFQIRYIRIIIRHNQRTFKLSRVTGIDTEISRKVMDSVSVKTTFKETLMEKGIIFCSFSEAVREHPDLVKKYLGSVVGYRDNFFAALNSAVFSDGSFVYIPKGVRCPMELSTYFRINARNTGQFERTLIFFH